MARPDGTVARSTTAVAANTMPHIPMIYTAQTDGICAPLDVTWHVSIRVCDGFVLMLWNCVLRSDAISANVDDESKDGQSES